MTRDLLEEVKRTYRNAKTCGKEGPGMHRGTGWSGHVHDLWMEAVDRAEAAGLDWRSAMAAVRRE